jgi:hypothetical protein
MNPVDIAYIALRAERSQKVGVVRLVSGRYRTCVRHKPSRDVSSVCVRSDHLVHLHYPCALDTRNHLDYYNRH